MTFDELEAVASSGLKSFAINWNHHGSSHDWTYVRKMYGLEFHRYRNVHSLRLDMDESGIWIKWRQFVTDESWSKPQLIVESDRVPLFAHARPPVVPHDFDEPRKAKYNNFLDKLETCA